MPTMGTIARLVVAGVWLGPTTAARYEYTRLCMGVQFRIVLYAEGERMANAGASAAFQRIQAIDRVASDYRSDSELMRLCRTAGSGRAVPVSPDLWNLLRRSRSLAERTGGAFDPTVGPLVRLWRRARRQRRLPSEQRLAAARQVTGYRLMRFDAQRRAVQLARSGMRLDLGGIAKGYAADAALAVLAAWGIGQALVDGGGDIAIGEPPPGRNHWRVAIETGLDEQGPSAGVLLLSRAGVATSGDARQHVVIDGRRYSHIVDPRTGIALTDRSSVTVVAPDCTTADGLASAISVLGPEAGLKLAEQTPGVAVRVVRDAGDGLRAYESRGWRSLDREPRGGGRRP